MSITLKTIFEDGSGTEAKIIWINSQDDYKLFQELVHKAVNLWPDAPASIKRFADLVTIGKVQQDYRDDPVRTGYPKKVQGGILSETSCSHTNTVGIESPYGYLFCKDCRGIFSQRSRNIVYHSESAI